MRKWMNEASKEGVQELKELISSGKKIVFFGGAGVSTASGIPDFRSPSGLYKMKQEGKAWADFPPEELLSHSFFIEHTDWFFEYYKEAILHPEAKPNACHLALAKWEEEGKIAAVVTQNIDALHQAAGSKKVYELHGSVFRNYCMNCQQFYDLEYVMKSTGIPRCEHCNGIVKPDVTLYEEQLNHEIIDKALDAIRSADILIVAGTSLAVYPAASFVHYFQGEKIVLLNLGETSMDGLVDLHIKEDLNRVFENLIEE